MLSHKRRIERLEKFVGQAQRRTKILYADDEHYYLDAPWVSDAPLTEEELEAIKSKYDLLLVMHYTEHWRDREDG